jgi:hypothetical protein
MGKLKTLSSMFPHVNKKEMEIRVKCDFVRLNVKWELEHSMQKEVAKRPMGGPRSKLKLSSLHQKWRSLKDQHQRS